MAIWGTEVTALQAFGYSIALGGLLHYKLGADHLKEYISSGGRAWAEYGTKHPAMRKLIIFGGAFLTLFILLGGVGTRYAEEGADAANYLQNSRYVKSILGDKGN